jgi:CO/xanthine dehydrogenase FAD-binding subunit
VSAAGARTMPVREFMVGVKRTAIEPGELIVEITVPTARGWQGYAKVGVRNAMVIAVASACLVVDEDEQRIALALGSVGPTIIRCDDAEARLAAALDWRAMAAADDDLVAFGQSAAAAARPISDHRSSAEYRRHAVGVLATRLARRALRAAA